MPKIIDHQQRRREIIEACWQVLTEQGSDGLSMRKIADAAQCAIGRITHYFDSREALIGAAIRASYDEFKLATDTILARDISAIDKLHCISDKIFAIDASRLSEAKIWLSFWNQAAMHESLAEENELRLKGWHKDLQPLMRALNPRLDPALEASAYIALTNGLNIQVAIRPTKNTQALALATLRAHIKKLAEY